HRADGEVLAPLVEPLPVGRLAGLDPGLTEHAVLEAAPGLVGGGRLPHAPDRLPGEPADRRVERREVEADRRRIGRLGRRPPLAGDQHRRLVVLLKRAVAGLAQVVRRLRLALVPLQPLEPEPLAMTTMGAWHEEAALVGRLVLALDARWTCLKKVDRAFTRIIPTEWRYICPTIDIPKGSSLKL